MLSLKKTDTHLKKVRSQHLEDRAILQKLPKLSKLSVPTDHKFGLYKAGCDAYFCTYACTYKIKIEVYQKGLQSF